MPCVAKASTPSSAFLAVSDREGSRAGARSPWPAGSQGEHAEGPDTSTDDLAGYRRRLEVSHPSQGLAVVPLVPSPVRRLPARSGRTPVLRPGHGLLLDFDDCPMKPPTKVLNQREMGCPLTRQHRSGAGQNQAALQVPATCSRTPESVAAQFEVTRWSTMLPEDVGP